MSYINAIRRPLSGRTLTKKHHESTSWTDMTPWRDLYLCGDAYSSPIRPQSEPPDCPKSPRETEIPRTPCKARSGFSILTEECLTFRTISGHRTNKTKRRALPYRPGSSCKPLSWVSCPAYPHSHCRIHTAKR